LATLQTGDVIRRSTESHHINILNRFVAFGADIELTFSIMFTAIRTAIDVVIFAITEGSIAECADEMMLMIVFSQGADDTTFDDLLTTFVACVTELVAEILITVEVTVFETRFLIM